MYTIKCNKIKYWLENWSSQFHLKLMKELKWHGALTMVKENKEDIILRQWKQILSSVVLSNL
jgi:hypothetical protein